MASARSFGGGTDQQGQTDDRHRPDGLVVEEPDRLVGQPHLGDFAW
jgi:hypothetical protein